MSDEQRPIEPGFIRIGYELLNLRYVKRIALVGTHLEITTDGPGDGETVSHVHEDAQEIFRAVQPYCVN